MTKSARRHAILALVAACLMIVLERGVPHASAQAQDNRAALLLTQATQAIADQDRVGAWQLIDLVRSNYPDEGPAVARSLAALDALCTEDQKVGRISVATWLDAKTSALSMTFDDALPSAFRHAAPDLEQHGCRGTFYLTDKVLKPQNKGPWMALARRGHEIGCHTVSHLDHGFATQPPGLIYFELNCCQFLTNVVTDHQSLTFAYPDSESGDPAGPLRTAVRSRYLAARSGKAGDGRLVSAASPEQMDQLISFPVTTATALAECTQAMERALQHQGWLILMCHAIIDHDGWEPIGATTWQGSLQLIDSQAADVWIAPLAAVASYIQARQTAFTHWEWDGGDQLQFSVWSVLDRTLPDTVLTVSVRVPATWSEVAISAEDDTQLVRDGAVTLNLRPDGRRVVLTRVTRPGNGGP